MNSAAEKELHSQRDRGLQLLPKIVRSPGSSWIHPGLFAKKTLNCGFGVFTSQSISASETIIIYGGRVVSVEQFESLSIKLQSHSYQIGDLLFLCPNSEAEIGVGELVNHSCSPSAGFKGAIHVTALRDIAPDEEITLDYATWMSTSSTSHAMTCLCDSQQCRKIITGQDWQLKCVQAQHTNIFQPYLQEKIRRRTINRKWKR